MSYIINPRILEEEIEKKIKGEIGLNNTFISRNELEKLESKSISKVSLCRAISAFFMGNGLRPEEFYGSTTTDGRISYHVKVNDRTLGLLYRHF